MIYNWIDAQSFIEPYILWKAYAPNTIYIYQIYIVRDKLDTYNTRKFQISNIARHSRAMGQQLGYLQHAGCYTLATRPHEMPETSFTNRD